MGPRAGGSGESGHREEQWDIACCVSLCRPRSRRPGSSRIDAGSPASAAPWSIVDLTTPGVDAMRLAQVLAGEGVIVSGATFTGDSTQGGLFTDPAASIGLADGVVMSSGFVGDVIGPNEYGGNGVAFGGDGDPDLDAARRPQPHRGRGGAPDDVRAEHPDPGHQLRVRVGGVRGVRRHPVQRRLRVLRERRQLRASAWHRNPITINTINPGSNSLFYVPNP